MSLTDYREKYKALGMCVSHPHTKAMPGHVHCETCVLSKRKGGGWYNSGNRTAMILGVRVRLGLLRRVL